MPENEYKYLDHAGLTRFKGKIQDILDTKVDKENGKYIVTVDSTLSTTSTNPVQNKVIASKLGSTDISSIGDGSVTGAISALNTDKLSIRPAGSTLLTSGQNLNSLGIGNYYTNSSSLTQSLVNAPAGLDTAIRLFVMDIGYGGIPYGLQIIVYNSGMYWRRCLNSDGSSWSAWVKFVDPKGDINYIVKGLSTSEKDFNNFLDNTWVWANNTAGEFTNAPASNMAFHVFTEKSPVSAHYLQIAYTYTGDTVYVRTRVGNSWNAWIKTPTRSEVDQLKTDFRTFKNHAPSNNTDFNTLTDPGFYYIADVSSAANAPQQVYGYLNMLVLSNSTGTIVTQILFGGRQSNYPASHRIWIRYCNSGTWNSTWDEYTNRTEIDKLNNDITTPTLVDDCNNATDPRVVYYANSTSSNRPDTTRYPTVWWFVRPFAKYGTNDLFQIATPISTSAEGSVVYTRSKVSGTGWSAWRRIIIETDLNLTRATYTPTITAEASSSTATFDNMSFTYFKQAGSFLVVSGRFRVAEAGSVDTYIRISIPSGFKTLDNGVGNLGVVATSPYNGNWFELRTADNGTYIRLVRSGGNTSLPSLLTNTYVTIFAFIPLKP